jgi:hypothetical protein
MRWLYEENRIAGSLDIAREGSLEVPGPLDDTRSLVTAAMTACLPRLGTTPENVEAWVQESLLPWQRAFGAHVERHGYLFGGRPALADFALFGGNAAHFVNDPVCRRWTECVAPAVVAHTHALMTPRDRRFGAWLDADTLPDTLIALLAEAGRHYLPWAPDPRRCASPAVRPQPSRRRTSSPRPAASCSRATSPRGALASTTSSRARASCATSPTTWIGRPPCPTRGRCRARPTTSRTPPGPDRSLTRRVGYRNGVT